MAIQSRLVVIYSGHYVIQSSLIVI